MQNRDVEERNASLRPPKEPRNRIQTDASLIQKRKKKDEGPSSQEQIEVSAMVGQTDEEYFMKHPRRGYALIFNHKTFECERSRKGTEKDVEALTQTFKNLGFDVKIYEDLNFRKLFDTLESTAELDHGQCDALVVTVMSHGSSEGYIHCYDASYRQEKLWKTFTADKCPSLAGKPKLFFIQACRGKKSDAGVMIRMPETLTGTQVDTIASYTLPVCADILIAQSTVPEHVAYIHPGDGSWFIQMLCKELDKNGRTHDLLDVLTSVCRRVATDFDLAHRKQVPVFTSMLTRQVFFR